MNKGLLKLLSETIIVLTNKNLTMYESICFFIQKVLYFFGRFSELAKYDYFRLFCRLRLFLIWCYAKI